MNPFYGCIKKESESDRIKRLETVLGAVERLNAILDRFRSFSHVSEEAMKHISLSEVIDDVYGLFQHELMREEIHCIVENEDKLPFIQGDSQGLQQVISNILINAMHALEDKQDNQRKITIKTYSFEDKIFVEIEDNGCGIPEEVQKRIFDPFFTTKTSDKGTGLGMAVTESILHEHHATIRVESEVGLGAKFTIVFPGLSRRRCHDRAIQTPAVLPYKQVTPI